MTPLCISASIPLAFEKDLPRHSAFPVVRLP